MGFLHVSRARRVLQRGGIIAYPTEAVWGLGCDPDNETACRKLLDLKQRPIEKGLILIAGHVEQVDHLLAPLTKAQRQQLLETWPGPVTWLIPDSQEQVPYWVKGEHSSVAVRVSAHPLVVRLCRAFGGPVISTSANLAGEPPALTRIQLQRALGHNIDYILPGRLGGADAPSRIIDLSSGQVLR